MKANKVGLVTIVVLSMLFLAVRTVLAETEHCPEGWVFKYEGEGNFQYDGITGTVSGPTVTFSQVVNFCVKASTQASGILSGDNFTVDWLNPGGEVPDISYIVIYEMATQTPPPPPTSTSTPPTVPPTETPTSTPTNTPTLIPPIKTENPKPTETVEPPVVTLTPTPTATENPVPPTAIPPSATPTNPGPTPTQPNPPVTETPPAEEVSPEIEGAGVCVEIDVKTVIRTYPSGYQRIFRIWVNDNGMLARELDLFRNFPQLASGFVQSYDIYNLNGCWVYFVFHSEGEKWFSIWRVDSYGNTAQRLTDSSTYQDIATSYNGKVAYSYDGWLALNNAVISNEEWLGMPGEPVQFLPDGRMLFKADGVHLLNLESENDLNLLSTYVVASPDGQGLYFLGSELELWFLDFNSGVIVSAGKWLGVALDPRKVPVGDIVSDNESLWWIPKSTTSLVATGSNLMSIENATQIEPLVQGEFKDSNPDWWHEPKGRVNFDFTPLETRLRVLLQITGLSKVTAYQLH